MAVRNIEISFPVNVEPPEGWWRALDSLIEMVCEKYQQEHPDRVMWPASAGSKPLSGLYTGVEPMFDDSVYHIGVEEREDYHGSNPHNPRCAELREAARAARKAAKAATPPEQHHE